MQRSAEDLLKTYLGERTGERVLAGRTTRGEGEKIHAVIWLCQMLVRVFDHDDGRIDHGADSDGDAAEAHDIGA
jgi:hypothetical protein